jgi:hypothetical protein
MYFCTGADRAHPCDLGTRDAVPSAQRNQRRTTEPHAFVPHPHWGRPGSSGITSALGQGAAVSNIGFGTSPGSPLPNVHATDASRDARGPSPLAKSARGLRVPSAQRTIARPGAPMPHRHWGWANRPPHRHRWDPGAPLTSSALGPVSAGPAGSAGGSHRRAWRCIALAGRARAHGAGARVGGTSRSATVPTAARAAPADRAVRALT